MELKGLEQTEELAAQNAAESIGKIPKSLILVRLFVLPR